MVHMIFRGLFMTIFSNVFGMNLGDMNILILSMLIGTTQNTVGDIQKMKYALGVQNLILVYAISKNWKVDMLVMS